MTHDRHAEQTWRSQFEGGNPANCPRYPIGLPRFPHKPATNWDTVALLVLIACLGVGFAAGCLEWPRVGLGALGVGVVVGLVALA